MGLKQAFLKIGIKVMGYKEMTFKVVGVTFKNDKGRKDRQSILRAMKYGDKPFDNVKITFERYEYEGDLAIGVYANGDQIGNVAKELVAEFGEKWKGEYIATWKVLGSGKDAPFGCEVHVLFNKK